MTMYSGAPGSGNGKKILFASVPADGHFNPLTGLAKHLQEAGYDVRWYAASAYANKLQQLGIPRFAFTKAMDVSISEVDTAFPERAKIKSVPGKLNFDMEHIFIRRSSEYYEDMLDIRKTFPFDLLICDVAFTGSVFAKELLGVPVIGVGVLPLVATSRDLAPTGLGLTPANTRTGKWKHAFLRWFVKRILFRKPDKLMQRILEQYGVQHHNIFLFDLLAAKADLILQSGVPGFEYKRSDLGSNIRIIGSLLPFDRGVKEKTWFDNRLNQYERVVLVTQGTVEKDNEKLLVPVLEAFSNTGTLVICTTGGSGTEALRRRYTAQNIIIEDFIPFADVMPWCDVYITNGGYGGVMLGITYRLPMVVAGVHEGKNEIAARVGYFKCGINLRSETPGAVEIKKAVEEIFRNDLYRQQVDRLAREFNQYEPERLCEEYVNALLSPGTVTREKARELAASLK